MHLLGLIQPGPRQAHAAYAMEELLRRLGAARTIAATNDSPSAEAFDGVLAYGPRSNELPANDKPTVHIPSSPFFGKDFESPGGLPDPNSIGKTGRGSPMIFPDDPIASTYFLLASHEERVRPIWDAHGRFDGSRSLLAQAGLLGKPLVEDYAESIRQGFLRCGLRIPPRRPWPGSKSFALLLTTDVDVPRRNTWTAVLKRCLGRNPGFPVRRGDLPNPLAYLPRGEAADPYVCNLERLAGTRDSGPTFRTCFFLAGRKSRLDPEVLKPGGWLARRVQRFHGKGREIALHAPYECWLHTEDFEAALERFERSSGIRPVGVRQHYLRFRVPQTWRAQAEAGLLWDASAGYSAREGFRFGTALPFQAFDGERGERLPLWIVPLAAMDTTLNMHLQLTPQEAGARLRALGSEARRVGGALTLLVHNTSTGPGWIGWPEVFDAVASDLAEEGAWTPTVSEFVEAWKRITDANS